MGQAARQAARQRVRVRRAWCSWEDCRGRADMARGPVEQPGGGRTWVLEALGVQHEHRRQRAQGELLDGAARVAPAGRVTTAAAGRRQNQFGHGSCASQMIQHQPASNRLETKGTADQLLPPGALHRRSRPQLLLAHKAVQAAHQRGCWPALVACQLRLRAARRPPFCSGPGGLAAGQVGHSCQRILLRGAGACGIRRMWQPAVGPCGQSAIHKMVA